jgi:hypothetical protein
MKALISPNETVSFGYRVVQIEKNSFVIALPLFWVDCPEDLTTEYFYDPNTETFKPIEVAPEQLENRYVSITQNYLDTEAKSYGYDSILSAVSYASDPMNITYKTEGSAFLQWRSNVWGVAFPIIEQIKNKDISPPEKNIFISMLPRFEL